VRRHTKTSADRRDRFLGALNEYMCKRRSNDVLLLVLFCFPSQPRSRRRCKRCKRCKRSKVFDAWKRVKCRRREEMRIAFVSPKVVLWRSVFWWLSFFGARRVRARPSPFPFPSLCGFFQYPKSPNSSRLDALESTDAGVFLCS